MIPAWFELGSAGVLVLILAVDVFLAFRRPHVPSTRESALWIAFYVVLTPQRQLRCVAFEVVHEPWRWRP